MRPFLKITASTVLFAFSILVGAPFAQAVQTMPLTSTSWYVEVASNETDTQLYQWMFNRGYELGQRDLNTTGAQNSVVIFSFGRPMIQNGQYGASGYTRFVSTTTIATAAVYFAYGYKTGVGTDQSSQIRMVVGTNNSVINGMSDSALYNHGQAWSRMVASVGASLQFYNFSNQVSVRGGNDIEVTYSTPGKAKQWLYGYQSVFTSPYWLYDFGDAAGCPTSGTTATPASCNPTPNYGWTQDDVEYASWGGVSYPIPEIYSTGGGNARQWQQIALYSYLAHGTDMLILSPLSQNQACAQRPGTCSGINNTPAQAWDQLWNRLNEDTRTAQDFWWSTDTSIKYSHERCAIT